MIAEKEVTYNTTNTYSTLNSLTAQTKNIWLVFHGMGYLSKYFIKYFRELDADKNYIIALQAPSKYYLGKDFKHVGASWLTRENTLLDTQNLLNYVDEVFRKEVIKPYQRLIILGYSQGVSIAMRWVTSRKIQCETLVLHSGAIPDELKKEDFDFLNTDSKIIYLYGNKDQYITEARETQERLKSQKLFQNRLKIQVFEGIHEVSVKNLLKISTNQL